jgi:hypothetical protein
MAHEATSSHESLIPQPPIPEEARAFSSRVHGLMDGLAKDDATVAEALEGMDQALDLIAAGLYTMASMLVGEGEEGLRLVETTIATTEISVCDDPAAGRKNARRALCAAALDVLARRDPRLLAVPRDEAPVSPCIGDDDLDAAGVSHEELARILDDPDRERVRLWLEKLSPVARTVFVLRAVAGMTATETARMLTEHGGPQASGWTADSVRGVFRQGLCSLASQLLQASNSSL